MVKKNTSNKMIPFIIALSFFMEAVDSTVINTAIPAMSRSLMVEPVDLKVALISYLLSLAIFIPISGWLADKFGTKQVFITALIIFTLSSLWCGFANSLIELILARFIQGLGGALGLPVGRLILIRTFGRENMITTMNNVVIVGALGMMLGPVIGGTITYYFSWHWIFWVNIPVGILTILLSYHYLHHSKAISMPPLDKWGFILFGTALASFAFGLSMLSEITVELYLAGSILLLSCLLLTAYTIHSHHQLHPIVNTNLLQLRTFKISVLGNLLSRLGFGGIPFLIPLLLQVDFGITAQWAGLLLAPIALGVAIGKPFVLYFLRAFGYQRCLVINTLLTGLVIWSFAYINLKNSFYLTPILTYVYGFILTLQYGAMGSLAYADIPAENLSAATSIMGTLQQLAQSFGVAISAIFIRLFAATFSTDFALTTKVFHMTFFALGLLTMLSALIFFCLKKEDGQQMIANQGI